MPKYGFKPDAHSVNILSSHSKYLTNRPANRPTYIYTYIHTDLLSCSGAATIPADSIPVPCSRGSTTKWVSDLTLVAQVVFR